MRRTVSLIIIFAASTSTVWCIHTAQTNDETSTNERSADFNFLQGLSSIQEWASKLEGALRSQGEKIDQRKAKEQLLPKVVAIQKSLSALEDINTMVVQDAGSGPATLNRDKMGIDLDMMGGKILDIQYAFADLREEVQVISIPEITDIERIGEGLVVTRSSEAWSASGTRVRSVSVWRPGSDDRLFRPENA